MELSIYEKVGDAIGTNILTPAGIKKHVNERITNFSLFKVFNYYFIPFLIVLIPFSIFSVLASRFSIALAIYPSLCWLFFIICFDLSNYFFGSKERKLNQLIFYLSKLYMIVWLIWFVLELLTIILLSKIEFAQILLVGFILYGLILTVYIIRRIYQKLDIRRAILLICTSFLIMLSVGGLVWEFYLKERLLVLIVMGLFV